MDKIKRALISVSDKEEIVAFAKELVDMGVEIISTGGTARLLKENGINVIYVSDYTGFPEMLDGRIKTLHPKIHGGILWKRGNERHRDEIESQGIKSIDLVVVNLYPFEETISNDGCTFEDAIENIDIGGPAVLRSAAKNFSDVAVVVNPDDYSIVIKELKGNDRRLSNKTRLRLAKEVFQHTARYDSLIANYLSERIGERTKDLPPILNMRFVKIEDMRYGENPHQRAAFYRELRPNSGDRDRGVDISHATKLHGKELSFNNIIDLNAAIGVIREFSVPAAVIIKHTNPCGVGLGQRLIEAYRKARETDPVSAFGGVVGFNRDVDIETAEEISSTFIEGVIAPGFDDGSLEILKKKKDLRLMELKGLKISNPEISIEYDMKKVGGGILLQESDYLDLKEDQLKIVTKRKPTEEEWRRMRFAWKVVKHVKSNAIVYSLSDQTLGIGAGQMSRVDSAKIAVMKANRSLKGSAMASDAFFPFRDAIDIAVEAGVTAIIQPGGSIRDDDVINAADKYNATMVFTGIRHFKH
ncbi:MAG: bifunctional phosphoribosylaminoimidazolecarboxamide formyltransferase/IMP cyclohydrolase [Nitrospinae bacterium]|nr:bifunctional phosphoribosylaminoimidazolecarboxamide formyltransferase/IMP cyclohydrolase [Nitrospinota bacterium]